MRDFRGGKLAAQGGCGGSEGGHPRRNVERDAKHFETPHLLGDGAIERRIARMDPRHVEPACVRHGNFVNDLVECQRGSVDDPGARRRGVDNGARDQRAGVQAHRAPLDQPQAAHRDQIGRARSGADKMHGHAAGSSKYPRGV